MGWVAKVAALLMGLGALGVGLWPFAGICFGYIVFTMRPKGHGSRGPAGELSRPHSPRLLMALFSYLFGAVAYASGGTYSPLVFFIAGSVLVLWPPLTSFLPVSEVVPQADSVLLRSRYYPLAWSCVAEVKAGNDPLPRALSHVRGRLLVFSGPGRAYLLVGCTAFTRQAAEAALLGELRSAVRGGSGCAYILPLDAGSAADVLKTRLRRVKTRSRDLLADARSGPGAMLLDSQAGRVERASAFDIADQSHSPSIPSPGGRVNVPPLLWEVLEAMGNGTRWPEPDALSSLLDSMSTTRGEPLADRVGAMEGSKEGVRLESLGGVEVRMSRPQFRAIVSLYS